MSLDPVNIRVRCAAEMRAIRARRSGVTEGLVLGFLYGFIVGGIVFVSCLRFGWLS